MFHLHQIIENTIISYLSYSLQRGVSPPILFYAPFFLGNNQSPFFPALLRAKTVLVSDTEA